LAVGKEASEPGYDGGDSGDGGGDGFRGGGDGQVAYRQHVDEDDDRAAEPLLQ
jgi:hypothetical protein